MVPETLYLFSEFDHLLAHRSVLIDWLLKISLGHLRLVAFLILIKIVRFSQLLTDVEHYCDIGICAC